MRWSALTAAALLLTCSNSFCQSQAPIRTVHVFVALADNRYQGIVPVPAKIGNGDDAVNNLYWGLELGVRTYFARSKDWKLIWHGNTGNPVVLERCVFQHRTRPVYLVADAYRGREIKRAIVDFLEAAGGNSPEIATVPGTDLKLSVGGKADLVAYVGHDGLMDFDLERFPKNHNQGKKDAILLSCASRQYFSAAIRASGAKPLLWTTNLMAPEAYALKAALDGWMENETDQQIQQRAAEVYSHYQKCSVGAAKKLLVPGW